MPCVLALCVRVPECARTTPGIQKKVGAVVVDCVNVHNNCAEEVAPVDIVDVININLCQGAKFRIVCVVHHQQEV